MISQNKDFDFKQFSAIWKICRFFAEIKFYPSNGGKTARKLDKFWHSLLSHTCATFRQ